MKNQWIRTKFELDLYLGMAKQFTKYKMNICKQREKSTENCKTPQGHNSSKNWSIVTIFELDL
jgi:hypothetical protein